MKKIYIKPSLVLENIFTDAVMYQQDNVLSNVTVNDASSYGAGTIHFNSQGSDNVLHSIDYSTFGN